MGLAIGGATLGACYVEGFITWPLGGFVTTLIYLLVVGTESAAAYMWDHRGEE